MLPSTLDYPVHDGTIHTSWYIQVTSIPKWTPAIILHEMFTGRRFPSNYWAYLFWIYVIMRSKLGSLKLGSMWKCISWRPAWHRIWIIEMGDITVLSLEISPFCRRYPDLLPIFPLWVQRRRLGPSRISSWWVVVFAPIPVIAIALDVLAANYLYYRVQGTRV